MATHFLALVVMCGIVTACRSPGEDNTKAIASASAAPLPPAEQPPPPPPVVVNASVATFTKDTLLDECVDVSLTLPPGSTAEKGQEIIDKMIAAMLADKKDKSRSKSRLNKPCAAQFRSNPTLATCAVHMPVPIPPKADGAIPLNPLDLQITSGYYSLEMIEKSDTYMKNCIDLKGDWETVDHSSEAWREAHMARARREVEKLQKTMGQ